MLRTSVIIPAYNAEKTIAQTLAALREQSGKDFEVIVVDDGSTDMTAKLVTQFSEQNSLPVKLIKQENAGPAKARNTGVEQAAGDNLVFLDSDCLPTENWVEEMTRPLGEDVAGCYCWNRVRNKESIMARYVDYEMTRRHERMIGKDIDAISTYSASFLKKVFLECGGFDSQYREASGEDFDLTYSIVRAGYRLRFVDTTFVYQYHPDSLRKYLYKQFKRGYWSVRQFMKNKDKILRRDSYFGLERQGQLTFSLVAVASIPLAALHPLAPLFGFGLLILSNLPFGIWAFKREKKFLFIAPLVASARSLAGTAGVFKYIISRGFR